jgi:selenocysteine lyase/cysteine desulfurase
VRFGKSWRCGAATTRREHGIGKTAVRCCRAQTTVSRPRLHYLDNAATAQMPELVLNALRRFEVEVRANVHEGMHARARAATEAYNRARACIARFLNASSDQEVVFTYGIRRAETRIRRTLSQSPGVHDHELAQTRHSERG